MEIKTRRETSRRWRSGLKRRISEGYQEELQKVRQEFAQRFLSKGMSREDVAEVTTLPLTEIDKLINSN